MQKGKSKKFFYQPAIGVKTDCETILQNFSSLGTVRYEKFAELWREMKFSMYCAGRLSNHEAREYVEECFSIAVQFWLPPSSFLVRAGALYLLYGLYTCQLVTPKVKIRVTQEQWEQVTQFHYEARQQQHLDLDYIFQKMLVQKAFLFVAKPSEFNPSFKEKEDPHYIPEILKEESGVVDEIFSSSAIGQLEMVHDQYQRMKIALNEDGSSKPDSSLDIIHSDLISGVQKVLSNHRLKQKSSRQMLDPNGLTEDEGERDDPASQTEKGTSVQKSLKKKAFQTSAGYFKSRKGQGSSEDTATESTDTEVKSPDVKYRVKGNKCGSRKVGDLYEKDDMDLEEIAEEDLGGLYSMPDLDTIVLPRIHKSEDTEDAGEKEIEGKGKAPMKGKHKLKTRKKSATSWEDESIKASPTKKMKTEKSEGKMKSELNIEIDKEKEVGKKKSKQNTGNNNETIVHENQGKKKVVGAKIKQKKSKVKSVTKTNSEPKLKQEKIVPVVKPVTKTASGAKVNETKVKVEKTASPKKPSAQELLNKALKDRKKKNMNKNKNKKTGKKKSK